MRIKKKKIMCVVGTRPELIRMAPVFSEIQKRKSIELQFVHTGQHYSFNMDKVFFNELSLPEPLINLNVGSGTQVEQVAGVTSRIGKVINRYRPDIVVVWGDTNSSLAAAIGAVKAGVRVAHLEAGCRSYDLRMPEETNRVLIDHCASILFPFSEHAKHILEGERVSGKIIKVGNPHYDIFLSKSKGLRSTGILSALGVTKPYILMTSHRAENVDDKKTLTKIVDAMTSLPDRVVLPVHPRTLKNLTRFRLLLRIKQSKVVLIDPVGYFEMMELLLSAKLVMTDSGGVQLEAFFAKKPCITIRKSTEWVETVELGMNLLADPAHPLFMVRVRGAVESAEKLSARFEKIKSPYGSGHGGREVVDHLERFLE